MNKRNYLKLGFCGFLAIGCSSALAEWGDSEGATKKRNSISSEWKDAVKSLKKRKDVSAERKESARKSRERNKVIDGRNNLPDLETRTGYINGKEITYQVAGDIALVEGDIAIGTVKEVEAASSGIGVQGYTYGRNSVWPLGVVPFQLEEELSATEKRSFYSGVEGFQNKSDIRFIERTQENAHLYPDYISVINSSVPRLCWSRQGYHGGKQEIGMDDACTTGFVIHELGHAVGLGHEQNRYDRDDYVRIHYENIIEKYKHNFNKSDNPKNDIGGYDFASIMHYSLYGMSKNGRKTITAYNPPSGVTIGQTNDLSDGDIAAVKSMYQPEILRRGMYAMSAYPGNRQLTGDFNGDGKKDIALIYRTPWDRFLGEDWSEIAIDFTHVKNSDGSRVFTGHSFGRRTRWMLRGDVRQLVGDFNGDGSDDIAFTKPGWDSLPVAFSNGNGGFELHNQPIDGFASWASQSEVEVLTGDFNGDGKLDITLAGGRGWTAQPVAFSNGDGTYNVTNLPVDGFAGWASENNVRKVAGDFNADGKTDIALVGGENYRTLPIALSNGDGTFEVLNKPINGFAEWAAEWLPEGGVELLTGDFNGDGRMDFSLAGGSGWTTQHVAFSNGDGTFRVTNQTIGGVEPYPSQFAGWASEKDVQILTGDFNSDGKTDIALVGGENWITIALAFSRGDGTFRLTNEEVGDYANVANEASKRLSEGALFFAGNVSSDRAEDIVFTIPGVSGGPFVGHSRGDGRFDIKKR